MKFRSYKDFAFAAEQQLNNSVIFPIHCLIYGSVESEIVKIRVNATLPQITFVVKKLNSRVEQTILYSYHDNVQVKFIEHKDSEFFKSWQTLIDSAFKQALEVEAEWPEILIAENSENTKDAEVIGQKLDLTETDFNSIDDLTDSSSKLNDTEISCGSEDTANTAIFNEFILWAVNNLRVVTDDKASFKKDIPDEFSSFAATKRTTIDTNVVAILKNTYSTEQTIG